MTGQRDLLPASIVKRLALSCGSTRPDVVASYLRWTTS